MKMICRQDSHEKEDKTKLQERKLEDMRKWLGPLRAHSSQSGRPEFDSGRAQEVTDDPLAVIDPGRQKVYSISRSVFLPRVTLRNGEAFCSESCSGNG